MTFAPEIEAALQEAIARLSREVPVIGNLLAETRAQGTSEVDAVARLLPLLKEDPTLAVEVERIMMEVFAGVREAPATVAPASMSADVVLPPRHEGGMPRLNPLYAATIQEKIQFDGDVPDLRTGPLPAGATPAVPVATEARDPVVLGWMLGRAAEEVSSEFRAIEQKADAEVRLLIEGDASTPAALAPSDPAILAKIDRANLPDPVGYERGKVPALREVEAPEGTHLATLTPEQRGQLAWKFVSTTQGRRTALGTIRKLMATSLVGDGFDVEAHEGEPLRLTKEQVLAYVEWSFDLDGPGSLQSGFAFVDTAARALVRKMEDVLHDRFPDIVGRALLLEVVPVNTVDVRKVGWAARVSPRETA